MQSAQLVPVMRECPTTCGSCYQLIGLCLTCRNQGPSLRQSPAAPLWCSPCRVAQDRSSLIAVQHLWCGASFECECLERLCSGSAS